MLHDIGKIGVPASILDKPGLLTDSEYRIIQEHPRMGARILEPIRLFADVIDHVSSTMNGLMEKATRKDFREEK